MKFFHSIKTKIILSILAIILLFGLLSTFAVFYFSRNYLVKEKKEELTTLAQDKADDLVDSILKLQLISKNISHAPQIVDILENPDKNSPKEIEESLYHRDIPEIFSAIYIIDKNGLTIGSTDPSFIGKNYSFRQYFKEAISGNSYIDVGLGVTSNQLGFYFSFPVKNLDGEIIGVAVSKIKPEVITSLVTHKSLQSSSDIIITDDQGVIIFSKKPNRLYKSLGNLPPDIISQEQKDHFPQKEIESLNYDLVQEEILNSTGKKALEFYDKDDNERELIVLEKLDQLPFYFIIEQNIDYLNQVVGGVTLILGLFVLGAAISAAIIISIIVSRFLNPLSNLTESIKRYSEGDLDYQPEIINKKDEVGKLAKVLADMSQKLKKTRQDIEKKIKDRTRRLENLNKYMVNREIKMIELKKEIKKIKQNEKQKT